MRILTDKPEIVLSVTLGDYAMLYAAAHALVVIRTRATIDPPVGPLHEMALRDLEKAKLFEEAVREVLRGDVGLD